MKVTKRDGTSENYSIQTVKRAIREAFKSSKTKYNKDITVYNFDFKVFKCITNQ